MGSSELARRARCTRGAARGRGAFPMRGGRGGVRAASSAARQPSVASGPRLGRRAGRARAPRRSTLTYSARSAQAPAQAPAPLRGAARRWRRRERGGAGRADGMPSWGLSRSDSLRTAACPAWDAALGFFNGFIIPKRLREWPGAHSCHWCGTTVILCQPRGRWFDPRCRHRFLLEEIIRRFTTHTAVRGARPIRPQAAARLLSPSFGDPSSPQRDA